eukprot:NODE_136_length_18060_cov_0.656645.p12 type:complete len:138 gc:universal NODE_136_length_18060_cov_0.656645:8693-8280(-)
MKCDSAHLVVKVACTNTAHNSAAVAAGIEAVRNYQIVETACSKCSRKHQALVAAIMYSTYQVNGTTKMMGYLNLLHVACLVQPQYSAHLHLDLLVHFLKCLFSRVLLLDLAYKDPDEHPFEEYEILRLLLKMVCFEH